MIFYGFLVAAGLSVLVVDYVLPMYGAQRFLTAAYAASVLSYLSILTSKLLAELYSRHALKCILKGTSEDGVIMNVV
jgi:hypothetical protein